MRNLRKGVELPVNILVLIAIAVLVLLGLVMLTSAGLLGANPLTEYLEVSNACHTLRSGALGCSANPIDIPIKLDVEDTGVGDGSIDPGTGAGTDNLRGFCGKKQYAPDTAGLARCKKEVCGCSNL